MYLSSLFGIPCVMDCWKGRVALVTGASVGIGAAIAKSLAHHGMKVVGCARNVQQIEKLASECVRYGFSGTLIPYKCDLSVEEEILSMFAWIKDQHHGVDVCINNAGLAFPEPLLRGKTSGWKTMMDNTIFGRMCVTKQFLDPIDYHERRIANISGTLFTTSGSQELFGYKHSSKYLSPCSPEQRNVNVIGLSVCTREAYQSMKERNVDDGHIININSICGHQVTPNADGHFYTATKYAVTALTEGLRQELREAKTHIRATCISPGYVETEFAYRLYEHEPEKAAAAYKSIKCLQADDIATAVVYVLSAPPHVQIGDIQMRPVEQLT